MLDLHTQALGLKPILWDAPPPARPSGGAAAAPDVPLRARWYELMLDEIDYGVLLLGRRRPGAAPEPLRRAASSTLSTRCSCWGGSCALATPPMRCSCRMRCRRPLQRGLRRLLMLGQDGHRVAVSVVPLRTRRAAAPMATQLSMGKRQMCGGLGVQWFARSHGLTLAETRVLEALSEGRQPSDIATRHGVGISTIRSQIGSIRSKTRSDSIGALVRQVAVLPPLVGALRGRVAPSALPPQAEAE